MSFNKTTQIQPKTTPAQPRKKIVALGRKIKREPLAAQKLRRAFLNIETQAAGRITIGVN